MANGGLFHPFLSNSSSNSSRLVMVDMDMVAAWLPSNSSSSSNRLVMVDMDMVGSGKRCCSIKYRKQISQIFLLLVFFL